MSGQERCGKGHSRKVSELQQGPVIGEASGDGRQEAVHLRVRDMIRGRGEKQLVPACEIPCEIPLCPCHVPLQWHCCLGIKPVPKARQGQGEQTPGWARCTSGAETPSDIPLVTEIGHR